VPRLFSALVPPPEAAAHLARALAALPEAGRPTPRDRWHVTLGFYGDDDDEDTRSAWLREALTGLPAPRLRLAGGGTFPGVAWVGVLAATEADERAFADLAAAARADPPGAHPFRPHLTVARWRPSRGRDEPGSRALVGLLDGYTGPWFTPAEVLLERSGFPSGEPAYTTVTAVPLGGAARTPDILGV
jgi:RNA 2',3'-cyclic 3'-phosphodiesterase